ncbi:MAG: radical SAM protein [Lentisphaeria bacterium]
MRNQRFLTGVRKLAVYLRISLHIPLHYLSPPRYFGTPAAYFRFLFRALRLLLIFRHNKVVRVFNGYKLHLYLPSYPSRAFFYALESKLLRRSPGPTTVVFSMTKACQYHCTHCYQRNDKGTDLAESLMLDTAREIVERGVAMFDIEGGEPFVRFNRLSDLLQDLDDRTEIWINTTGAGASREKVEKLKVAGLFGLMVSIHSPDAEIHDQMTGVPGSFQTACDILQICRDLELTAAINTVLSEAEVKAGGIDRIMDLSRQLDCDYVQLIHPKPAGEWLGRKEEMQTSSQLLAQVRREHLRYNSSSRKTYPSLAAQVFEESESILGCTAGGVDRFYVGASGEVQPCEFLNISFGNIKDEPFAHIFARMRSYFPCPCTGWLCCTQAEEIYRIFRDREINDTPLPWSATRELVDHWGRGRPTPIYRRLGIYK